MINHQDVQKENNAIHDMIVTCDEMIEWLSGRDEHGTMTAIGKWLDRRSALVKAYEAILSDRPDSFTRRLNPYAR